MLYPIIIAYGIDPIHFGLVMVLNMAIGLCTPPVGSNLFVASSIGNVRFSTVTKAVIPFVAGLLFCLLVVTYVPLVSLALPKLFGMM